MTGLIRGRLAASTDAPARGERVDTLVGEPIAIEHILSGRLDGPVAYDQERDEWVAVLEGSARLEIDGTELTLTAGDWILIPRRTPHRLLHTQRGTRWLAVHF